MKGIVSIDSEHNEKGSVQDSDRDLINATGHFNVQVPHVEVDRIVEDLIQVAGECNDGILVQSSYGSELQAKGDERADQESVAVRHPEPNDGAVHGYDLVIRDDGSVARRLDEDLGFFTVHVVGPHKTLVQGDLPASSERAVFASPELDCAFPSCGHGEGVRVGESCEEGCERCWRGGLKEV